MVENRFVHGGIDSDSALHLVKESDILLSKNVRFLFNKGQNSGVAKFIEGTLEIPSVAALLHSSAVLLGKCVYAEKAYLCYHSSTEDCIIVLNSTNNTASKIFSGANVTGWQSWTNSTFVDCQATSTQLFIADGGEPKYLNTDTNYTSLGSIPLSRITLISEPPVVPLTSTRIATAGIASTIQKESLQFTYRFITVENFTSTLAPYSITSFRALETDLQTNTDFGNQIIVEVSTEQKIPVNWKWVELVVRYVESNTFFVIKQWGINSNDDITAVNSHNSATTPLEFTWSGENIYALDELYIAKQFDSVPLSSSRLALAANRLLLANNTEGYDTPTLKPGFEIDATDTHAQGFLTWSSKPVYLIRENPRVPDGDPADRLPKEVNAVVLQIGADYYLFPKDLPGAYIQEETNAEIIPRWHLPEYVPLSALRKLETAGDADLTNVDSSDKTIANVRGNLLNEANGTDFLFVRMDYVYLECKSFYIGDIKMTSDALDAGSDGNRRVFSGNSIYSIGIQYYDNNLRKCGVLPLDNVNTPIYGPNDRLLLKNIEITLNNTVNNAIPNWATYYSIVLKSSYSSQRAVNFSPGILKVVLENTFLSKYVFGGKQELTTTETGYNVYGLGISINFIPGGYTFKEGDFIEIVGFDNGGTDNLFMKGRVKKVIDGYLVFSFDLSKLSLVDRMLSDASPTPFQRAGVTPTHRQDLVYATLYTPSATSSYYEVGCFGKITNGVFDYFFGTNNLTCKIQGDHFTFKRVSSSGTHTGYSFDVNDSQSLIPITDLGRITPSDTIGQKVLNSIRWSNAHLPSTNTNGYASFDALDYKLIEAKAGKIQGLRLTTKGVQEGGQMLILCEYNSFAVLIGKRQIFGTNQDSAFTTTAEVLGDINTLQGEFGCQHPKSIVEHKGLIFWLDKNQSTVVEFSSNGVKPISRFKANSLWANILRDTTITDITAGVNAFTSELLVSVNSSTPSGDRTYVYNIEQQRWIGEWESGAEMIQVGNKNYAWKKQGVGGNKMWLLSDTATEGFCFGTYLVASLQIPFNSFYPKTVKPLAIELHSNRSPDTIAILSRDTNIGLGEASISGTWQSRRGTLYAAIGRNRLSNNAVTEIQKDAAGVNGSPMNGTSFIIVGTWDAANGPIALRSIHLNFKELNAQL